MALIERLFPRWTASLGAMLAGKVLVRSQCRRCGIQQRVDVEALVLKLGGGSSLIDRRDVCSVVACHGQVFYLASRTYGRQWLQLVSRDDLLEELKDAAPAENAQTMLQLRQRIMRGGRLQAGKVRDL